MLDKKPSTIADMFDGIAATYDRINHVLSFSIDRTWRKRAVRRLSIAEGDRVIDIATGTGDMALYALRHEPTCTVTGVDLSLEMLNRAVTKAGGRGFSRRSLFVQGDASCLPIPDRSMHRAMVAFGIRNMDDRDAFFDELHRILAPGGRAAVLEFSLPKNPIVRFMYLAYFRKLLPSVGAILSGNPGAYRYLTESVLEFPSAEELSQAMEERGFLVTSLQRLSFGIAWLYLLRKKEDRRSHPT